MVDSKQIFEDLDSLLEKVLLIDSEEEYENMFREIKNLIGEIPSEDCIFTEENLIFAHKASKFFYKDTKRKMSDETNFPHAYRVATLLHECGASEDAILSGYLHDVIEDTVYSEYILRMLFSKEAVDLVLYHTEDKSKSWMERKKKTVMDIIKGDNLEGIWLVLSDRIANMESLASELPVDWTVFAEGEVLQYWYFKSCIEGARQSNYPKEDEYRELLDIIFI